MTVWRFPPIFSDKPTQDGGPWLAKLVYNPTTGVDFWDESTYTHDNLEISPYFLLDKPCPIQEILGHQDFSGAGSMWAPVPLVRCASWCEPAQSCAKLGKMETNIRNEATESSWMI